MRQVFFAECHPETGFLDFGNELDERFEFLVPEEVAFARPDLRIVDRLVFGHRRDFVEFSVFVELALLGDFADVDFRVEVRRERLSVISRVAIDDIERVYFVEIVLLAVSGIDVGNARIESGTEERHDSRFLEAVVVGPLPGIFEMRLVLRLVVRRVDVIHALGKARVHDGKVLVGERDVYHQFRLEIADEGGDFRGLVGIDFCRVDGNVLDVFGDCVALGLCPAREKDFGIDVRVFSALADDNVRNTAGTDNQDLGHFSLR